MKNLEKKVNKFQKTFEKQFVATVPDANVFRLLVNKNFNFKNKNILDIGIGYGANLLEFKNRGAKIFGIDIRSKILKHIVKKNSLNSKNFFANDLNINFPNLKKKMDLVLCKDTIYYLNKNKQFFLFKNIDKILNKNGYFLFQYIQSQFQQKNKDNYSFSLNNKPYFKLLLKFFDKKNPIVFLKEKHIKKLIKHTKLKIKNNFFDISMNIKNQKVIISVNRFILLQK